MQILLMEYRRVSYYVYVHALDGDASDAKLLLEDAVRQWGTMGSLAVHLAALRS